MGQTKTDEALILSKERKEIAEERKEIAALKRTLKSSISDVEKELKKSTDTNSLLTGLTETLLDKESANLFHQDIKKMYDKSVAAEKNITKDAEAYDQKLRKAETLSKQLDELKDDLYKLKDDYLGDEDGNCYKSEDDQPPVKVPAIKKDLIEKRKEIDEIKELAQVALHKATDKGLHSTFEDYRNKYSESYWRYNIFQFILLTIISSFGLFSITGIPQYLIDLGISFPVLALRADLDTLVQLSFRGLILLPLIYLSIILNRNANIQKALAEEYAHKASLTKSVVGYRELYNLEHKNDEYTNLFKSIVDGLNANPADKVIPMLNKKTPQENLKITSQK